MDGQAFADAQVAFGKTLKGLYDYETAWNWALAMTREQRRSRFEAVLKANGKFRTARDRSPLS